MQFRLRGLIDVIAVCHSKELLKIQKGFWHAVVVMGFDCNRRNCLGSSQAGFFNMIRKKGSEKRRFTDED